MNINNILETIRMIEEEKLDIRTITMGISLIDCIDSDGDRCREKIYNKIVSSAKDLVKVGREIENEFGIPIVNKRVSVTPISIIAGATDEYDYIKFAQTLDKAAQDLGIDFIGGFSALVNVGSTKCGLNMDAIKEMGTIIKETAELTKESKGFGCAKLVVFCNAVEDNPFMAGAFHGIGEDDKVINVGVSGPGVVQRALEKVKGQPFDVVADTIKNTAFKVTRMGQLVGYEASKRLGVPFGIVDLSLAPTPAVGDSVADILEEMGLEAVGTHGTTAALALLNDAVKKGGVMACSRVGGLSGAFIPVSEDAGMINAVLRESLNLEKLEAMTAVCSVGLDMIAVSGDTSSETISAMIADEAAIGMINNKTTAVRVIPAPGCKVGDMVEFGGLLGRAPVMEVNKYSSELFIKRGGKIPAPIHSFKN